MLLHKPIVLVSHSFIQISLKTDIEFPKATCVNGIFTSVNAIKAIIPFVNALPEFETVYCISGATEHLAKTTFGARPKYISATYATILAQQISASNQGYELWFFKGNRALPTIPKVLAQSGIDFRAFEVYENKLNPLEMEQSFDAILFFSPSAVESFLMDNFIPDNTITFAIGTTTAAALEGKAKHISIADAPSESAVVEAVMQYFNL